MKTSWPIAVVLIVLLVAFRIASAAGEWYNFTPLPAFFLCSMIFLRGREAWMLPLLVWAISNPIASWLNGYQPFTDIGPVLTALLTLVGIGLLAIRLRDKAHPAMVIGAGIAAGVLFHLVTNTVAWLVNPIYAKNATGLWQSLWLGPVGSPVPSWVFLRNLVGANVIFTTLFLLAQFKIPALSVSANGEKANAIVNR